MFSKPSVLSGALLVAGTSIGAGMLALPIVTAPGGFGPSLFVYLLCWLFMTCTGLLFTEISLKIAPDANLISMASRYLGWFGKMGAWVLYLFLFYCLSIAYLCGGGALLSDWLGLQTTSLGPLLFLLLFAPFVYFGAKVVDRLNRFLMLGLIASYAAFMWFGTPHVNLKLLQGGSWSGAFLAMPVIFTSFSYQGIVPTLVNYMERNVAKLRACVILGTSFSFTIYLLWQFLILGIIPVEGEFGLEQARILGQTAVQPLKHHLGNSWVVWIGQAFAFFAITTSYVGVTLGLFDFLADGFRMAKKGLQRFFLAALTFLPPLVVALSYPTLFISALVHAGGIGCAILLGAFPVLMVWVARKRKEEGPLLVKGGEPFLALCMAFVFFELLIEAFNFLR